MLKTLCSPTYDVSMTQVSVGENVTDLSFNAIFDSGTGFTHLNDPAYTAISESVSSLNKELANISSTPRLI